jgi:hypothetical protein
MIAMFGILLLIGAEIYQKAPHLPKMVISNSGEVLYTLNDIETGQNVWQSIGGMVVTSNRLERRMVAPRGQKSTSTETTNAHNRTF